MYRQFIEEMQMPCRIQSITSSLRIKDNQINMTMTFHFLPLTLAKVKIFD